jgi:hypothetical protein
MGKKEASVGHWESPITSQLIVSTSLGLSARTLLPNGRTYFLERRPGEQGRSVLVTRYERNARLTFFPCHVPRTAYPLLSMGTRMCACILTDLRPRFSYRRARD